MYLIIKVVLRRALTQPESHGSSLEKHEYARDCRRHNKERGLQNAMKGRQNGNKNIAHQRPQNGHTNTRRKTDDDCCDYWIHEIAYMIHGCDYVRISKFAGWVSQPDRSLRANGPSQPS